VVESCKHLREAWHLGRHYWYQKLE